MDAIPLTAFCRSKCRLRKLRNSGSSLSHNAKVGRIYLAGIFIWVAAITAFALSRRFWLSLLSLLVFGLGQSLVGTITITLLQTRVAQQMRGRVMSLNTLLIMGVRPLGDFPAGALMAWIGAPVTVLLAAMLVALYGLVLVRRPALRAA